MPTTAPSPTDAEQADTFPLEGTDHVELWVGNAKQASHYYRSTFGYDLVAYSGPETGQRDRASYVLRQGRVRLVLTTPLRPTGVIADHVRRHGDGVRDIALRVEDARTAFETAVERGAEPERDPEERSDDHGTVVTAAIRTYGDTVHSLVERSAYDGPFLPGFVEAESSYRPDPVGLRTVDHCVGNVELGAMDRWVDFYQTVMGFKKLVSFDDEDISTEYSSLMSKVVSSGDERIKFPINEPAEGRRKSQIDEFLEFYGGPGVQHVALATDDILRTVTMLRDRGVDFLSIPTTYYDELQERVGAIDEPVDQLAELGILVDRDPDGYLLQIFTAPQQDRPTLFYEIIQRKGARSFGKGNFRALFEAIERAQELRGNL